MRILVTGAGGTVGRGLTKELRSRGNTVFTCDLYHDEGQWGFRVRSDASSPTYARCNIGEYREIERLFRQCGPFELVYNCAAEFGRWNGEDYYESLWRTNAIGTKNIIRLQEELGFRLVHFSSSEVYGDWTDVMSETVMDDFEVKQLNDYALSKWVNEQQIRNSAEQYGTESVVVRLFNTYGPGEYYSPYRSVNCRFLYCALAGIPFRVFAGHERTSTYLADTVRTVANISETFVPGRAYNVGGTELHTIEGLAECVLDVTGASPDLVEYAEGEALTTKKKHVDVSLAREELGHADSYGLREGLELTAQWMRDVYGFGQDPNIRPSSM